MELYLKFDRLISYCDEIVLAPYVRERLKTHLLYFRTQSLCDVDRRDRETVIGWNWRSFKMQRSADAVIANFVHDAAFWRPIAEFVGDISETAELVRAAQSGTDLTVKEFFTELFHRARTRLPAQPALVKLLVPLGLKYLSLEADRKATERDHAYIRKIWKLIWSDLTKHGLLDRYRDNPVLKARVQNFVANGFYSRDENGRTIVQSFRTKVRTGDPDHDYSGKQGIDPREPGDDPREEPPV